MQRIRSKPSDGDAPRVSDAPWWRQIQWFDVVLVLFAVLLLLILTAELWLPHASVPWER